MTFRSRSPTSSTQSSSLNSADSDSQPFIPPYLRKTLAVSAASRTKKAIHRKTVEKRRQNQLKKEESQTPPQEHSPSPSPNLINKRSPHLSTASPNPQSRSSHSDAQSLSIDSPSSHEPPQSPPSPYSSFLSQTESSSIQSFHSVPLSEITHVPDSKLKEVKQSVDRLTKKRRNHQKTYSPAKVQLMSSSTLKEDSTANLERLQNILNEKSKMLEEENRLSLRAKDISKQQKVQQITALKSAISSLEAENRSYFKSSQPKDIAEGSTGSEQIIFLFEQIKVLRNLVKNLHEVTDDFETDKDQVSQQKLELFDSLLSLEEKIESFRIDLKLQLRACETDYEHFTRQIKHKQTIREDDERSLKRKKGMSEDLHKTRMNEEDQSVGGIFLSRDEDAAAVRVLTKQMEETLNAQRAQQTQRSQLQAELAELNKSNKTREQQDADLLVRETKLNLRKKDLDNGEFLKLYHVNQLEKNGLRETQSRIPNKVEALQTECERLQQKEIEDQLEIQRLTAELAQSKRAADDRARERERIKKDFEREKRKQIQSDRNALSQRSEKLNYLKNECETLTQALQDQTLKAKKPRETRTERKVNSRND
ncbi:hypothetical protein BLNAU_12701 [Blattamonas nauphoetae]|uniref:Uncharacterized protein n=1 Tax=Blattamonas nauphoetae TaxID=2049346 RepID=A0ABQ9XLP0_9EUKA|nr:hypothetical protein BLNAU_12701 [Blattamonas nauphoetae]